MCGDRILTSLTHLRKAAKLNFAASFFGHTQPEDPALIDRQAQDVQDAPDDAK
jgi:hypothetical protein